MRKLLLSLLILVFSATALGAEEITHNGVEGVFIEKTKAAELTIIAKEHSSLKKQKKLLEEEVKVLKGVIEIKDQRVDVEKQIAEAWKKSFETATKELSGRESEDDVKFYVYVGLFVGGTIVGASIMYGASHLLNNIR